MRRTNAGGGPALPSGTVTFLFTDIERSTQRAETLGDVRFADQLAVHRSLLGKAFAAHEGLEVGIEGDALFVAFARAGDGVNAALEGQRALHGHEWPAEARISVRMGLHTGDAVLRQGEYVGREIHKARRICDAGHGGQILLSEATVALVADQLPNGVTLADLGHHRLKDLGDPLRIYQLVDSDMPHDFPPLRSLEAFRHNLPLQRSPFVGRDREITEVRKLLDEQRLVTLTGIGGCGKTRLALQLGAEELDRFPHGVFLVELAALSDGALIPRALADAVGMVMTGSFTGGTSVSVEDLLVEHLGQKKVMLVLDNCEHLLDGCARIADLILSRCPNVTILTTTREALEVEGEQTWPVPSLSVPSSSSEAELSEAVALFRARAQAVQPNFELTRDNIPAISEICQRLDGLPLAIELAASRVSHLSPRQIADRLDDMFRLLTGGRRRVPRQQTLAASLDWSYDLLDDPERVLLRRLAVFAGTFELTTVEQVCSDGDVSRGSIINLLGSLVDKSLVDTEHSGSETRYRLLEPVRLYAGEHLRQAGESHAFRERHRDHYLNWVESFAPDEATFGFAAYHAFEREHYNLRAALEWSEAEGRYDVLARLANGLLTLWWNGGYIDEGRRWLTTALERSELREFELVRAYASLTACSIMRVDAQVRDFAMKALDASGDDPQPQLAIALSLGATFSAVLSEITRDPALAAESRTWTEKAITVGSKTGPAWKAFALIVAGQIELVLRDVETADKHLREALHTWQVPSLNIVAGSATLSVTRHILGDATGALDAARIGAQVESEWWRPCLGANSLALALAGTGEFREAHHHLANSIRNAVEWGVSLWLNEALVFSGVVAFLAGDARRASGLLAAGRHLGGAPQMATPFRTGHSYALYLHYLPLVRAAVGPKEGHRTRARARAMSVEEVTAYALEGLDG